MTQPLDQVTNPKTTFVKCETCGSIVERPSTYKQIIKQLDIDAYNRWTTLLSRNFHDEFFETVCRLIEKSNNATTRKGKL